MKTNVSKAILLKALKTRLPIVERAEKDAVKNDAALLAEWKLAIVNKLAPIVAGVKKATTAEDVYEALQGSTATLYVPKQPKNTISTGTSDSIRRAIFQLEASTDDTIKLDSEGDLYLFSLVS